LKKPKEIEKFILSIGLSIEKYLFDSFCLGIESSEIKNINIETKEIKPYLEIIYSFRYSLFIRCGYNLKDYKLVIINGIRKVLSGMCIADTNIVWVNDRKIGEYNTVELDFKISEIEEIKKSLNKFKFISQKNNDN